MSTAESVAVAVLKTVIGAVPALLKYIAVPDDDDTPLAAAVRKVLPERGASAAAVEELERRASGG